MTTEVIPDDIARAAIDPRSYADDKSLHAALRWLRRNNPLGRIVTEEFDPFWMVTKHADILEISRQNDLFHNGDLQTTLTPKVMDRKIREMTGGSPHLVRSLVQMDPPDHPKYRVMTQAWFLPQNIRKLEDHIREIAREHVNHMAEMGGECDFVTDVALTYPLRVIMEILGVPREDEPRMLRLTQELFGSTDPDLNRSQTEIAEDFERGLAQLQSVIADFFTYFDAITQDRRAHPREDVASVIANGQIDGHPLGSLEAMSYYMIVATAGHDTTSSSTAGAVWGLCEFPEQFAKAKADPSLIPGLVEEAIRWTTPVKHFMRSATADTELRGRQIKKGDWLFLSYPSGNRDEEVFDEPDAFRIDRKPNKQLAFGYGAHVCLGQHLARMEMRILFEEIFARVKSIELNGEPRRSAATFVGGPKTVPIRYVMN